MAKASRMNKPSFKPAKPEDAAYFRQIAQLPRHGELAKVVGFAFYDKNGKRIDNEQTKAVRNPSR